MAVETVDWVGELEIDCAAAAATEIADKTARAISKRGVAILRSAYRANNLSELFEKLSWCREKIRRFIQEKELPDFDDDFDFRSNGMAVRLSAIDPETKGSGTRDDRTESTTLYKEIARGPAWPAIRQVVGDSAFFEGSWVRIIDPGAGAPGDRRGALLFHQEKWGVKDTGVPLGHNMWVLLNLDGDIASKDTAGLQFAVGDERFWRNASLDDYEATTRPVLSKLNRASAATSDRPDEIVEHDGFVMFRPKLAVGDIAFFDHHIPHASFVPPSARATRISCDLRVFPITGAVDWAGAAA